MKLYTSISVSKLASFNDRQEAELLSYLLCYKHKMSQLECEESSNSSSSGGAIGGLGGLGAAAPLDGKEGSALDIHYFISGDMVHVDEAEKQRRFENFFMAQIAQSEEILRDIHSISTRI